MKSNIASFSEPLPPPLSSFYPALLIAARREWKRRCGEEDSTFHGTICARQFAQHITCSLLSTVDSTVIKMGPAIQQRPVRCGHFYRPNETRRPTHPICSIFHRGFITIMLHGLILRTMKWRIVSVGGRRIFSRYLRGRRTFSHLFVFKRRCLYIAVL